MESFEHIVGAERLVSRFGTWPSFHDAEVVRLSLDRGGNGGPAAEMVVHVWSMTGEVDERGYYRCVHHTLVRFLMERMTACDLSGFNHQNVLFDLEVTPETTEGNAGVRVTLDGSYGMAGTIACARVVVADVTPCDEAGRPTDGGG